ncbi:hypothetical protein JMG10_02855 [Nostoc ellipsosporum NOK]|nr:hypothetical protein [Nostoc ellipsosporum NOK]
MRKLSIPALFALLVFTACQKEVDFQNDANNNNGSGNGSGSGNGNAQELTGNYRLVGATGESVSSVSLTQSGMTARTDATSFYHTKNNVGTLLIDATKFNFSNIGYLIDTTVKVKAYMNNILILEQEQDWYYELPPQTDAFAYRRVNADSLHFPDGFTLGSNVTTPNTIGTIPPPNGARISWSSDTLLLKFVINVNTTVTQAGVPTQIRAGSTNVLKFKKS